MCTSRNQKLDCDKMQNMYFGPINYVPCRGYGMAAFDSALRASIPRSQMVFKLCC